jgi:hypothetical protein
MDKSRNNILFMYVFIPLLPVIIMTLTLFILPKYLYKNNPVAADIMIAEGWLPDYALGKCVSEFNAGDYKLLVTVGTEVPEEFRIHSLGSLIFNIKGSYITNLNAIVKSITINARGTDAAGEYPHFFLYINDTLSGESYVNKKSRDYVFFTNTLISNIQTIKIEYDNDGYTKWKDRDLYVKHIKINDISIPAWSDIAFYDMNSRNDYRQYSPMFNNSAEYAAFILSRLGFTDSIKAIPVINTKFSRTYSCALAFKEWYLKSSFKDNSVNIVSLGPHSRRTWMTYRRVLGKNADVGIIMVNNEKYNKNNWWKSLYGIKATIHEMASYIYTLVTLPFLSKGLK